MPATTRKLTPLEERIHAELYTSMSCEEIAMKLTLSINTVRNAVEKIYNKKDVRNRIHLMAQRLCERVEVLRNHDYNA